MLPSLPLASVHDVGRRWFEDGNFGVGKGRGQAVAGRSGAGGARGDVYNSSFIVTGCCAVLSISLFPLYLRCTYSYLARCNRDLARVTHVQCDRTAGNERRYTRHTDTLAF